ncbi:sensor histidine kinase [Flavobacterium sp. '19STA2R22 D10 B1']|uniref:sensor histidine kinase n=1 Tax=Flavobacterium aerium TaxID=3037261 RepID=UPI00278C6290|nr:sensor histidine kinase [Flavobacterium sp. '19STA2R22 D10 B1']
MAEEFFSEQNKAGLIVISGVFLMFLMGIILMVFFYFSKRKIVQKEMEKKDAEVQFHKDLLQSTIMTQEEERKRIAHDLHDDISSKLNIISLNCHILSMKDLKETEAKTTIENILELSGKAIESSRQIAHNLFPPVLERFGLDAGIEELCNEFSSSGHVKVNYNNNANMERLDSKMNLHVFRILQELMNNSLRHGKATIIDVSFDENQGKIRCSYKDNGIGFDTSSIEFSRGLGMKNIESRIDYMDAKIGVTSSINNGVKISMEF